FIVSLLLTSILYHSLHDALPISHAPLLGRFRFSGNGQKNGAQTHRSKRHGFHMPKDPLDLRSSPLIIKLALDKTHHSAGGVVRLDRKSTRLNSSHVSISYAVFCL